MKNILCKTCGYLEWGFGLDLSGLGWEWVAEYYEHGNRPLESRICSQLLDCL